MDIRRPSDWAKCNNQEYLGHFREDKYLDQGHNDIFPGLPGITQQGAPFKKPASPKEIRFLKARSPYAGMALKEGGLGK
jgi:hypothetical protein